MAVNPSNTPPAGGNDPAQAGVEQTSPNTPVANPAINVAQGVPTPKGPRRIGDILIESGLISQQQLERALSESRATGIPVGAVLVKLGYVTEKDLGRSLATLHGLRYIDTDDIDLDPKVMRILPEEFIKRNLVVPLAVDEEHKRLDVIMARPDNTRVLDEVSLITGFRAIPRVSTHNELLALLDRFYVNRASSDEALSLLEEEAAKEDTIYGDSVSSELEAEMEANDAPVVQLVNSLLAEAFDCNASDIHIEPQKERLLVRFRVDDILREVKSIPKKMASAVVSRIKVASGMDIAERRRPQDGRMKMKIGGGEFDMRVNSLPIQFGEKVVIRILRPAATSGGMEKLGLTEQEIGRMMKMVKAPHGIILVTGPTGSGKTTTLYSCLREINSPERNISTIEDPIEYPLAGINQTQVSHKAGLSFSVCLRALLRQDPDVILVGEIRDEETLESAIHAALTGHLVFSTLHTNSCAKTVTRLMEMGAPAYLVGSAVIGIVAQRLVRRICPKCREPYAPSKEELEIMNLKNPPENLKLYKGAGCERCAFSGYESRVGLYEIMYMNREIQELIESQASTYAVQDAAIREGMLTLAMDGKRKVLAGITTVDEITRVLGVDLED